MTYTHGTRNAGYVICTWCGKKTEPKTATYDGKTWGGWICDECDVHQKEEANYGSGYFTRF